MRPDNHRRLLQAYCRPLGLHSEDRRLNGKLTPKARSVLGAERQGAIIIADDGGENTSDNADVAASLKDGLMSMLFTQEDSLGSNSKIERVWISIKYNFLFTQTLDSIASLRRFVDFYIIEHNTVIPHSAFN